MADPVMIAADFGPNAHPSLAAAAAHEANARPDVEGVVMGRLLNTYLREVGGAVLPDDESAPFCAVLRPHGRPVAIELGATGLRVLAAVSRASEIGHHEFAGPIFVARPGEKAVQPADARVLAEALLAELAARHRDAAFAEARRRTLAAEIESSLTNTVIYAQSVGAQTRPWFALDGIARFIAAEQSLAFGHPFHPAPKSGDRLRRGEESDRPEEGASFRLQYFAVTPGLLLEDRLDGFDDPIPADVIAEAKRRLPTAAQSWPLLPVHPWQARVLLERPAIATLVARDQLIPVGKLGRRVFPTSSVRTVYDPGGDRFIKLALDARITNFVRNNPIEHLERSLVASRVLATVPRDGRLGIVPELGYRGLQPAAWDGDDTQVASLAVLFRNGLRIEPGRVPVPVAALVEPPLASEPPIAAALWTASRTRGRHLTADFACEWARAYCEATLVPLLALYVCHGISLEAHVQNTLIVLCEGWPCGSLVRDLEGTSISRRRAMGQGFFGGVLRAGSPILVDEDEAWRRLLYYAVVNHLGHVLAALATHGPAEEWQLWQAVRLALADAAPLYAADGGAALSQLLNRPELPAKANLTSRFEDRSEKPRYVQIPNPFVPPEVGR